VILGRVIVPPTWPVCWIEASHSDGLRPSPVAGNWCVRVQESTAQYCAAAHLAVSVLRICVVTLVRRLRVKNVGDRRSTHFTPESQTWSNGTSGQLPAVSFLSWSAAQVIVPLGRQRSATSKTTRAAGALVNSSPWR
jgi:hypothetical protein